ncbi:MAG: ABC transporter substrate-binding protein [Chloroflexi bacterium]|nr:Glutathione-binding protein GsiB [Anaerolineae bacterium]MCC6566960.1 ABC transporter substrate-binding protein [Chloroflexota bacterium]MDL1914689.1 ABC transporter substrate-binding protein [Anaerolineae bacterium CFX4]MCO6443337.1 ABC transporter substrate-binding protein [Anaerolineae bacterium]MEB2365033.1 ABC transporter substrate-binding protein [Chloroflexota bacterium]
MSRKLLASVIAIMLLFTSLSVVAQDAPAQGGSITIGLQAGSNVWTRNFSPFKAGEFDSRDLIYEPLIVWNPVDYNTPNYWLATGYTYSDDLKSLTFTLREGVLWSDGEAFNADDVIFTAQMLLDNPQMDAVSFNIGTVAESVEKVDDYTVTFHLKGVNTLAHTLLSVMNTVPEHIWSSVEKPAEYVVENPVGTGPFTEVTNFQDQEFTLCRNPNYWQEGRPYLDCINFPALNGNQAIALALLDGSVEWAGVNFPDEASFVNANPEHHHYYYWTGSATQYLVLNTTRAPLDDAQFRIAVSMLIDYDFVVDVGMEGATQRSSPTGFSYTQGDVISQDALALAAETGFNSYDFDRGTALLDELGYVDADGDGFRDYPDGSPLHLNLQAVNGFTAWVASTQIMAQAFQDAGLNITQTTLDFGAAVTAMRTGDFDLAMWFGTTGVTPWTFYRDMMYSALIDADGVTSSAWPRWTSERSDELIEQFTQTTDAEAQAAIIDELQSIYVENAVAIPMWDGPVWYNWNDTNITGFPTEDNYYATGAVTRSNTMQTRLIVLNELHLK